MKNSLICLISGLAAGFVAGIALGTAFWWINLGLVKNNWSDFAFFIGCLGTVAGGVLGGTLAAIRSIQPESRSWPVVLAVVIPSTILGILTLRWLITWFAG